MSTPSWHHDDEYTGPNQADRQALAQLDTEFNEPVRTNTIPPRTLQQALHLADQQHLEPWTSHNGRWIGLHCPTCKQHGQTSNAIIEHNPAGHLIASCPTCHDNIHPGILNTLGTIQTTSPNGNGTQPDPTLLTWTPLDLVTLGDTPRIPPAISGLIYPGRRHLFWGESESGKSWLALGAAANELKAGNGVIWVDLDYMGAQDILERLRQLGIPDQAIRERFAFYQPDGPLEGHSLDAVLTLIRSTNARLVVIDAFTGLCALHNLNPEKTIDIEAAFKACQPLCTAGAGVVILDHVVKNPDNRGRYALGAERKLSGADVAIGFTLIEHYGRGVTGRARLIVHKDRPAQLQRPIVGIFALHSHPDTHNITWNIEQDASKAPDGAFRPTGYMESVSRYLERFTIPVSRKDILNNVTGKDTHLRTALERLAIEGFTIETPGPHGAINVVLENAFREDEE